MPPVLSRLRHAVPILIGLMCSAGAVTYGAIGPYGERLLNLSTRAETGTGENVMISGFVISGDAPKTILIRAVGPQLARPPYGMAGTLPDPVLRLYDRGGVLLRENDNWQGADATTFAGVGAFSLDPGSRDAAIVATLAPGTYTAHVTAASGAASGITLVEVYDVSGAARLVNISTRARVGTGDAIVIPGVVVGSTRGPRRLLVRAAGPSLRGFGVSGVLENPALALVDGRGVQIATNDDWEKFSDPAALRSAFETSGAFSFPAGSGDAALIAELPAGLYTLLVSGVGNSTGITLVEVYDLTPEVTPVVSIEATSPATEAGGAAGVFTITRAGDVSVPLTVNYAVAGTAQAGVDYVALPGSVTIPAGEASTTVMVVPLTGSLSDTRDKITTLTVTPGNRYEIGTSTEAGVTIMRNKKGALFVANLRPSAAAASTSIAQGTATLQLSEDERRILVNVSFSNLGSPQTVAYLRLGAPDGLSLVRLPNGQVSTFGWTISSQGEYSFQEVVEAIKAGQVYVSVDTAGFPSGELQGAFVQAEASASFVPPPPAPQLDLSTISEIDAARFLTQATYGPTPADIEAVRSKGYHAWIDEQLALPPTLHAPVMAADFAANNTGGQAFYNGAYTKPGATHRLHAWWAAAVQSPDQLRQRMAFALSELFVISDEPSEIGTNQVGVVNYYDLLVRGALGNFRDLLEQVTLNPMMGLFLSHLRNAKGSGDVSADENYAREVMQLFTIGLRHLNPDGTLKIDAAGLPVPTYDQTTVSEMARVFTGWGYYSTSSKPNFRSGTPDYLNPMMMYPAYHDDGAKTIVAGVTLPAGQGGAADLKDALDALFNHPNTGPFIARQLIQRLVTSNPSPGYVYRVAEVFADNGAGVRGDLGAVARAILLDYEARAPQVAATLTYGKLKEPLLRMSALFRACGAPGASGRFAIGKSDATVGQSVLRAPSVFNFFEPEYVQPGALAAAGLVAPEFQILTDVFAVKVPNHLHAYIYTGYNGVTLDFAPLVPLLDPPGALLDRLNLLFCAGSLSEASRTRIITALNAMPASTTAIDKVRAAVYLVVNSPAAAIQK